MKPHIGVLGAGSWGTALAILLARNGCKVSLWGNEPEHIDELRAAHSNERFLPGIVFPDNLQPINDFAQVVAEASRLLVVVPSLAFVE